MFQCFHSIKANEDRVSLSFFFLWFRDAIEKAITKAVSPVSGKRKTFTFDIRQRHKPSFFSLVSNIVQCVSSTFKLEQEHTKNSCSPLLRTPQESLAPGRAREFSHGTQTTSMSYVILFYHFKSTGNTRYLVVSSHPGLYPEGFRKK